MLVEKPLFTDPADLDRVRALGLSAPVWVAMEYRYMPPVAALIAAAQQATGGIRMLTIREHRFPFLPKVGDWNRFNAQTGGTLVEKCCHFFDLMRHILRDDPVRIMASGGQDVNHLDEAMTANARYLGQRLCDRRFQRRRARHAGIVHVRRRARATRKKSRRLAPKGKIECLVPGPGRFWPAHLGDAPVPQLIESPRTPKGPARIDIPVDPALLAAGDHNGSTYYQHVRFAEWCAGRARSRSRCRTGSGPC